MSAPAFAGGALVDVVLPRGGADGSSQCVFAARVRSAAADGMSYEVVCPHDGGAGAEARTVAAEDVTALSAEGAGNALLVLCGSAHA